MFISDQSSRAELEAAILSERDLYASFDEAKLLGGDYTDEELRNAIAAWIEAGNEAE